MKFTLALDTSEHTMRDIINRCTELKNKGLIENYTLSPEINNNAADSFNFYNASVVFPKNTMKFIPDNGLRQHPVIKKMCNIVYKGGGYVVKIKCNKISTINFNCFGDQIFFDFVCNQETMKKIDDLCFEGKTSPAILSYKIIRKELSDCVLS